MTISENTKIKLYDLENIITEINPHRGDMDNIANDLIDNHTGSLETSIGYAVRLVNLLCDYFYENDKDLYEDLDDYGDKIKKLYDELNY